MPDMLASPFLTNMDYLRPWPNHRKLYCATSGDRATGTTSRLRPATLTKGAQLRQNAIKSKGSGDILKFTLDQTFRSIRYVV
jgi:hypothetical protein